MMGLAEAARAIGARALGAEVRFTSVSSDSRAIEPGALFVALRGERFDGRDFVDAAKARGAVAAMVDADAQAGVAEPRIPRLEVDDTRLALGRLAAHWRARFAVPLIAVAGSNGKTTVKEMIAAILAEHFGEEHTLASKGNLNNDIGLPLTLLRLRGIHRAAVVEIGMNHPGETGYLADIAKPTIGLINNAQREHQEFMKSVADVAREHGALLGSIARGGIAVINADDDYAPLWRALSADLEVRDYSIAGPAAVLGRYELTEAGAEIELSTPEGAISTSVSAAGAHNVRNSVAAAAAATAAGASLAAVRRGLKRFTPVRGRLQFRSGRAGVTVIDDSYNANPDSVRAAIEVLARVSGRRVLVLGDMGEVGEQGVAFHREVGRYASQAGVERLLAHGELSRHTAQAFGAGAVHFDEVEPLIEEAAREIAPGTTILVKGSRSMRMERVVAALVGEGTA